MSWQEISAVSVLLTAERISEVAFHGARNGDGARHRNEAVTGFGANILFPMVIAVFVAQFEFHQTVPGSSECAWVFNVDKDLKPLTAVREFEALDDMHLLRVRRAETVNRPFVVQTDRIDNQCVAILVMAHRFS